jgi:5-methyltetrahydrofolate--homocysteine methyltransferase
MKSLLAAIQEKTRLVVDGGWGTLLMARGLQPGECPELWNTTKPEAIRAIAREYLEAGAEIITTNSFGGSRCKLSKFGLEDQTDALNEAAAACLREAAGDAAFVMGSVGPTGHFLMMGDITEEAMFEAFKEQAQALERGGADVICVETMSAIDEACLAVRAAKEHTGLEVICSFTYASQSDGVYRTMMGVSPAQMAEAALAAGADILGSNCSFGPQELVEVVAAIHQAAPGIPIMVNPNAGQPVHTDEGDTYPETPESMAGYVPAFIAAGANLIGGCCGSTPAHIRAIAAAVHAAR